MFLVSGTLNGIGKTLYKIGVLFQGKGAYIEKLKPSIQLIKFEEFTPQLDGLLFHANNSSIIGDVTVGKNSSVWYSCVLRADGAPIKIGTNSHLLDNVIVHINDINEIIPTIIGDNNIVMPHCIVHASHIQNNCYVGANSILLDGSKMEDNSVLLPHSLLTSNKAVKEGQIWGGSPAKFIRNIEDEEAKKIALTLKEISERCQIHSEEDQKNPVQLMLEDQIIRLRDEYEIHSSLYHRRARDDKEIPKAIYDRLPPEMTPFWIHELELDPEVVAIKDIPKESMQKLLDPKKLHYRKRKFPKKIPKRDIKL